MRNPLAIGAATLLIALVVRSSLPAAPDDSSDDTLSNSELIAQADEICTKYDRTSSAPLLEKPTSVTSSSSNAGTHRLHQRRSRPALRGPRSTNCGRWSPNEDDAEAFNDMLDTLETELQAVDDDPEAAVDSENPFPEATAKAEEFGLEACGAQ